MRGNNLDFLTDPIGYLQSHKVLCYLPNQGAKQRTDINTANGNTLGVRQEFAPAVEWDFVPNKAGGYVSLDMLGVVGTYGGTRRFGRAVVANYIPYLGQKDNAPSSGDFGRINLSRVQADFVFTFTFTGCSFVATQEGGDVFMYHEPTAGIWTGPVQGRYGGGNVVFGPMTTDADVIGGFGCLIRDKFTHNRWHVVVQSRPDNAAMTATRLRTQTIDV